MFLQKAIKLPCQLSLSTKHLSILRNRFHFFVHKKVNNKSLQTGSKKSDLTIATVSIYCLLLCRSFYTGKGVTIS